MQRVWTRVVNGSLDAPFLLAGCTGGEPLHRFVFEPEAVAPQTTALTLAAGESLSFWNSLDLTYQTDTTLNFVITVQPEAQAPIEILCDALNPTSEFMTTTITTGNTVKKSWKIARMKCGFGPMEKRQTVTITAVPKATGTVPLEAKRLVLELKP